MNHNNSNMFYLNVDLLIITSTTKNVSLFINCIISKDLKNTNEGKS